MTKTNKSKQEDFLNDVAANTAKGSKDPIYEALLQAEKRVSLESKKN